jgi:hypothetical protein
MPMTMESNGVPGRIEDGVILEKRLTLPFQLRQRYQFCESYDGDCYSFSVS